MSDTKISALTSYTPPISTDVMPIVDVTTSTTKKITIANLMSYIASLTQTLTNKTFNLTSNTLVATSAQLAAALTDETGSGSAVFATSPTLVTPTLGAATATSINGNTFTTGTYTLTGTAAKTLNFTNTLTLSGTDSTTMTFPTTSATIARTDAANTFTGTQTIGALVATTVNGNTITTGSSTFTGTAAQIYTFPTTTATLARTDAAQTFTGTQTISTITAPTNASLSVASGSYNTIQTYTPGVAGTATLDLSKGNIHHITMPAGNITIALSNATTGQCFIVRILQDGTGSRTVTWFTTIKWAGGSAPTLTTTASKADTLGFEITGANTYDGYVVGQNI